MIFEFGEEYFEYRCNNFKDALKAFRASREMWNWWKYQYYMIDEQLLNLHSVSILESTAGIEIYRAQHLGLEHWPNRAIVDKAMKDYERIAQNIIKESQTVTN